MANSKIRWGGYEFTIYDADSTTWHDVGGLYVFSGKNSAARWVAYYIGETQSFADRISSHEKWAAAKRLGATHVHARTVRDPNSRKAIEQELIDRYSPSLNN